MAFYPTQHMADYGEARRLYLLSEIKEQDTKIVKAPDATINS